MFKITTFPCALLSVPGIKKYYYDTITIHKRAYRTGYLEPENVIGSSVQLQYVSDTSGTYLIRTDKIQSVNDKYFKPSNIGLHIGKKPIFAAGNSDGDYEMMELLYQVMGL